MSLAIGKIISFGPGCSPANCVGSAVAATLSGVTVAVTGEYVADLQVESSTDNGASWISVDTLSNEEVTRSYLFANIASGLVTNFRVRGSSWTSGAANVNILPLAADVTTSVSNFPDSQTVDGSVTTLQGNIADVYSPTQHVTVRDTASITTPVANGAVFITGTPVPGSTAVFALASGYTTMRFQVTGTWTGTLQVEMSADNAKTWCLQGMHQAGTAGEFGSWTQNFIAQGVGVGFTHVRLRSIAPFTGTAFVMLTQSINTASVYIQNAIKIKDQVNPNLQSVIKAASTPAVVTDQALVVAISPNNSISVSNFPVVQPISGTVGVNNFPAVQPVSGTVGVNNFPAVQAVQEVAADLAVTATGIAGAAVTATLPAVATKFHYITMIEIVRYSAANVTNSATPTTVTTTNFPGNVAFTLGTTQAAGNEEVRMWAPAKPIKSLVAGTATTVVCPATPNVIWRVNVWYTAA